MTSQSLMLQSQVWEKQYLRGVKDGRVNFVPIDFLKQSPVPSDVFYVCLI